jgi:uncharacterized membrane protein
MNKNDFLATLESSLINISSDEKKEIIYDYEEHFRIGEENGKSEEVLIKELGDPKNIARQYRTAQQINLSFSEPAQKNVFTSLFAAVALAFFNLIFILGPYVGLIGVFIGLFAASIGITIAGGAILLAIIAAPLIPQFVNIPANIPSGVFAFYGVGTLALGALFFIGVCYAAKYFYIGTVKYLKWNMNIIRK